MLLTRLFDAPTGLNVVRHGVAELARHNGPLSIKALREPMGISPNHLLTQFKRMVGISPKALARLYRLKHILRSIHPTHAVDWTQIAHQSDYYDQAHFSNDFREFTGHSQTTIYNFVASHTPPARNKIVQCISCQLSDFLQDIPSPIIYDSENDLIQASV